MGLVSVSGKAPSELQSLKIEKKFEQKKTIIR